MTVNRIFTANAECKNAGYAITEYELYRFKLHCHDDSRRYELL